MTAGTLFSSASFRDPDAVLEQHAGRVLRLVRPDASAHFEALLSQPVVRELIRCGELVATWQATAESIPQAWKDKPGTIYEHERVPFVSYPCEWSPVMLARAAEFTLELALKLLDAGLMLKDASPSNVLFRGGRPVFIDMPSIVRRKPGSFLWLARQQFESCFLLPLIANMEAGIPIAWSLQDPTAGVSHERIAEILGSRRWLKPSLIGSVALPAALNKVQVRAGHGQNEPRMADDARATFIMKRTLGGLLAKSRVLTRRLAARNSAWNDYHSTRRHYDNADLVQKRAFVTTALAKHSPSWTLDIGANTGEFSCLAAAAGSKTVALEVDEAACGTIFRRAVADSLDIQPLVVNFARPTPASGWQNAEARSFLDRSRQSFDLVLMLAVIHHLRVTHGVPLTAILDSTAEMCRKNLIVEFVPPTDPMFVRIARGRDSLYNDYTRENFETLLGRQYKIENILNLPNGRTLYLAHRV